MIHWVDEFMWLFGYARPEVWEAERKARDVTFPAQKASAAAITPKKLLTLSELRNNHRKCHAIYQMVDAFTDEQIAKEIGATTNAVKEYRLLQGWRRR